MTPPIIRTLISHSLDKSTHFHKPFSCSSISIVFYSSSTTTHQPNPSFHLADHLITKHGFSPELASKAASSLLHQDPGKCDSVISFLKDSGFSKSHIEEAVRRKPNLLYSSLEKTVKPKLKIFHKLGFSTDDVADIFSVDPWILNRSVDGGIAPSLSALKSVLGSNAFVIKLLKTSSWFLKSDLQKSMIPNIEKLRSVGISSSQIVKYVFNFPRFFLQKPEMIEQFIKRTEDMGLNRKSNMFLIGIRVVGSMTEEIWELKLQVFRRLGFSEEDILSTFRRTPQVFAVSERKIMQVTEFLHSRKNIDKSCIINLPAVFLCSVERRLKPRLQVIDILESKNLLKKKPCLGTVVKSSEKQFRERYVDPYLKELDKASMAVVGS